MQFYAMDFKKANQEWYEEESRRNAYLRDYSYRKERYSRDSEERRKNRPAFVRRMEKLTREYRRRNISWQEYEKQKESIREQMLRRNRYYDEYGGVMWDDFVRRQDAAAQSSDSSSEDDEATEARFSDLEEKQRQWHISLDHSTWHTVYVTKKMVSDGIILCNEYNVDRIIEISKDLKEPVFLTKMAYYAVKNNAPSCLKALIKHGGWVNQRTGMDENKYTPLLLACKKGQDECVEVLIYSHAKVDKRDVEGNTCLLLAMHSGCSEESIRLLLRRSKISLLQHVNQKGENVLHHCGPFETTGKHPTKRSNRDAYALILKTATEKKQLLQLLEMRDKERDYTPIFDAVLANDPENVQLLVEHGAVVDAITSSSLPPSDLTPTPVHLASEYGYSECLKCLLKGGASPNVRNKSGETPIVRAFKNFHSVTIFETAETLLEHGAKVHDVIDKERQHTVFHEAVLIGHEALVDLFLLFGANPLLSDADGLRPVDVMYDFDIHEKLSEETTRLRSLVEICKWKIRESIESGGSLQRAVQRLPLPRHLQFFVTRRGRDKPHYRFTEESSDGATAAVDPESLDLD